ncbi:murein L,D-transpeptidase catalytic domain family protein [Adhaeribacter rhizoryzae]|uniref:Murein L,D-transpeptidase catalytic domain family protein n=1 Tax=Adhaeribacter rhizoryzae TaxID=2607907 RepID=A0A5M6DPL1_9BACT|nr:murein L,D-transpeptidase catalytic domain family protein [Adhaeribacter rhizoryzae]KAA5549418.1 murein L,D-transpeptidase catalytic domain family protein [Adhaeribacter rhizoryzae]
MKNSKIRLRAKWGRRHAKKAIPLFASFFLAHSPVPAGSTTHKQNAAVVAPSTVALKFIQFELEVYDLYEQIGLQQAGLSLEVFNQAMVGYLNLLHAGELTNTRTLTIADFDKSSSEERFWVIDLENKTILHQSLVAHGKNSGENMAEDFSNVIQSEKSSLGFFVTQNTYQGRHGLSLKLAGMDEEFNKNAYDRNIVVHGAEYVSEDFVKQHGRLGRSQGCPALPMKNHKEIIQDIKDGSVLYLHASNADYKSKLLDTEIAMNAFFKEAIPVYAYN